MITGIRKPSAIFPYTKSKTLIQWACQAVPSELRRFRLSPRKSGKAQ